MGLNIARHLGLRVPDAEVLDLPRDFPWQAGTDEFYEATQRSTGANLGVAFIPDAHDLKAPDLAGLPEPFVDRLAAIDALLQNVDRTLANPNIMHDVAGAHWAIDFGACLLFDRLARGANEPRTELPPNHFLAGRGAAGTARSLIGQVDAAFLEPVIDGLPGDWLAELGLTRPALLQRLAIYLADVGAADRR